MLVTSKLLWKGLTVMSVGTLAHSTLTLTDNCGTAIENFVLSDIATGNLCTETFVSIVEQPFSMWECMAGPNNLNCFDPLQIIDQALGANSIMISPYEIPTAPAQCRLCSNITVVESDCISILSLIVNTIYGIDLKNTIAITTRELIAGCSSYLDTVILASLLHQTRMKCQTSELFGFDLTEAKTLNGVLDMRSMLQCGSCAMIPCLPGQWCPGDAPAKACPERYYCPSPADRIICPTHHFCPPSSVAPIKCRGLAAGSCRSEGTAREVVWIPLLIVVLLLSMIMYAAHLPPPWLRQNLGSSNIVLLREPGYVCVPSSAAVGTYNDPQHRGVDLANLPLPASKSSSVSVEFSDLFLRSGANVRLNNVSGRIRSGKFTAIIGGSGAGKTTLMNVLLGVEVPDAGTVAFRSELQDGRDLPSDILERIVGFVPQNDVLLHEMTVEQLLMHSASWRLPSSYTLQHVRNVVETTLARLGLIEYRHVIARTAATDVSTISPGVRKKVNVGVELVAAPSVCFFDEPTTGIDASSAMSVAHIIRDMAKQGVTCVAVVHQPRSEIFALIDDIIILVPGGRLAYQGPSEGALAWLAQHGHPLPHPRANKTDFILDVMSLQAGAAGNDEADGALEGSGSRSASGSANEKITGAHIETNEAFKEATEEVQMVGTDWAFLWERDGDAFIQRLINLSPSSTSTSTALAQVHRNKISGAARQASSEGDTHIRRDRDTPPPLDSSMPTNVSGPQPQCSPVEVLWGVSAVTAGVAGALWGGPQLLPYQPAPAAAPVSASADADAFGVDPASLAADSPETAIDSFQSAGDATVEVGDALLIPRPGFVTQLRLSLQRAVLQRIKAHNLEVVLLTHLIAGSILGIVTSGGPLYVPPIPPTYKSSCPPGAEILCNSWQRLEVAPASFLMTMMLGAIAVPSAVATFGREKEYFARETAAGCNKPAYFLGKVAADLMFSSLSAFFFIAPLVAIAPWRAPTNLLYLVILCVSVCVSAFGYFVSSLIENADNAVLTGTILAILLCLFSGFVPKLGDGAIGRVMYTHWSARAIVAVELQEGQGVSEASIFDVIVPKPWSRPNWGMDLGILILMAVALNVLAFSKLSFNNRRKHGRK